MSEALEYLVGRLINKLDELNDNLNRLAKALEHSNYLKQRELNAKMVPTEKSEYTD